MLLESYKPTYTVEAVYNLTVDDLKKKGITALLVDLDNTLIAWNNPEGTPQMRNWLDEMKNAGFTIVVVSNNNKKRVSRAVEKFDIDFIYWALKPFNIGIKKALSKYNLDPVTTVMIGDQLMTDIKAAHRAGIRSILVKPLVQNDSIKTKINRMREQKVLKALTEKYGQFVYKTSL